MTILERVRQHQVALSVLVLSVLAYLPSLTASPGRMPADSKLYVYLNPGRFLADATTTFDPRQFAGWVPHQHIAYLWPTGPWFWLFETVGVPDWIAHRLWIGTLLVAAGLGVRWMARVLGFNPLAALAAGLVYQLSPYILPYISRTSVLLLPWAGLGWIVGLTILATRQYGQRVSDTRWERWRYPAGIALVVLTVGAVNATALAMVIPAPVLWLAHAVWSRLLTWRQALAVSARTGSLCVGVSLWWIVMLLIQGRNGADVLAFSESLEAVSLTSTPTEVSRGLGYWLFYVRDAYSAATTASIDHLVSLRTIIINYAVMGFGLAGIVLFRWEHRRFAALLVGAGFFLGVGVHPIEDPSPLMSLLVGDGEGGLALALRSSTRAVPVMLLGLSLGVATLVSHVADGRLVERVKVPPAVLRVALASLVAATAIVALPALRNGGFVDEALERDQTPPAAWTEAAAALDARPDGYRVLQVPGTEFGAFQWGYTVDQPLPALTERALVTRDLLPLGSPAAMDLVFALDDRFQTDTIEPRSVAAVSRLLGVDTVWVSGDIAFDRFRLARPEVVTDELTSAVAQAAGLVDATGYGDPTPMPSAIPMIDNRSLSDPRIGQPIAPVTLIDVEDPVPTVRVKDHVVLLAGSGDGIIDAAAAGLIDGTEAIIYTGSVGEATPLDAPYRFVLTDSNRDRAHHWRSSQDVNGFTETVDADSDVLRFESGDQRLNVFPSLTSDEQTVSIQDGPVTARASSYGELFAYLPEHRPVMAIDGDLSTAWLVADRAPAVGEFIELHVDQPIDHLDLLQPEAGPAQRTITDVEVSVNGAAPTFHKLFDASRTETGQRIAIDAPANAIVVISIAGTSAPLPPIGEAIGAVGFVEIGTGLVATRELIRTPIDGLDKMSAATGIDIVLTRLRNEPTDRWRSDPESSLARRFETSTELTDVEMNVEVRLDSRYASGPLAQLLGDEAVASSHLLGAPEARGAAAFDSNDQTAWTTNFDEGPGEEVTFLGGGTTTEITIAQPGGDHSPITLLRITDRDGSFDIDLPPGADAVVDLPRPFQLDRLRFEIVQLEERLTQNRRFNEPTVLPAALSEILFDGESPRLAPRDVIASGCSFGLVAIDGIGVGLRFDATSSDVLSGRAVTAQLCEPIGSIASGTHEVIATPSAATGFNVDRVVISTPQVVTGQGRVDPTAAIVVETSSRHRVVEIPPCPDGCWLVHGEGFNTAWTATIGGADAGPPLLIDGNANGWWIEPTNSPTRAEIRWTAQSGLNIAFALSAASVLACLVLVLSRRRRPTEDAEARLEASEWAESHVDMSADSIPEQKIVPAAVSRRHEAVAAVLTVVGAGLFVGWVWTLPVLAVWAIAISIRRPQIVGWVGGAVVVGTAIAVTWIVRTDRPFPGAGWPLRFEWLSGWTMFGVVLIVGSSLLVYRFEPDEHES
jgi:arabinofuranan 3-O-arabinosyltransferase